MRGPGNTPYGDSKAEDIATMLLSQGAMWIDHREDNDFLCDLKSCQWWLLIFGLQLWLLCICDN